MIKYENKKLLIVPIILTFLIALYVTLNTNGPLSWDIYTHINYSLAYLINGLTTTDPLLNAPIGKTIGYAPLFHILLILTSSISGLSLIQSAQVFQVVFVTVAVISVVYISHKLYGSVAGCVSGMLLLASFMFTRLLLPIPETIAVIFFLWGVYFYYIAIDNENIWYVFISVLMGLLILAVHFSTFVYYVAIISALSLIYLILSRKLRVISSYLMFLIPLLLVLAIGY
ncbi:MAG: glycosyltransferase family 39 protein, partial [Methanosphaera sp.]|nr:glycosyltransferase family 39 protein [Methanosphaera sp.]